MPFHNPYNFLPAFPRHHMPAGLGDATPAGHHRHHPDLLTGTIDIELTTRTPLLIMRERGHSDGHQHWEVATTADHHGIERVDLAASSLKGMLRSAYEAITNSRLAVFDHSQRTGYRAETDTARSLKPALIRGSNIDILGNLVLDGRPAESVIAIPTWSPDDRRDYQLGHFHHRQKVEAVIFRTKHGKRWSWQVESLLSDDDQLDLTSEQATDWFHVAGHLCVAGPTIQRKRAERLFITEVLDGQHGRLTLTAPHTITGDDAQRMIGEFAELIDHQRSIHQHNDASDIEHRDGHPPWEYLGHEPGRTAWSRHLYQSRDGAPAWLGPDTVPGSGDPLPCWIETLPGQRKRLRPVMISRILHDTRPVDLLDHTLRPASGIDQLSPADRVFGWAHPAGSGAHRAQLSVTRLNCPAAADTVEAFDPLTLPPLSSPKPVQARFYLGEPDTATGVTPLNPQRPRAQWFTPGQVIRGRKVYPHQRWMDEATSHDDIRARISYQPPEGRPQHDTQNATIHNWVTPGAQFTATLDFHNLSPLELGALLWLLDPHRIGHNNAPGRHRIGRAKPLGFGSIELRATAVTVRSGIQIAQRLRTLNHTQTTTDSSELADQFDTAMSAPPCRALLNAFRHAATGYPAHQDVHYPRNKTGSPGYEWFVNNNRGKSPQSLPALGGPMIKEN